MTASPEAQKKFGGWSSINDKTLMLFLGAVSVFVYAFGLNNAFLYDDHTLILNNDYLRSWSSLPDLLTSSLMSGAGTDSAYYRPLQSLLYLFLYQTFGPQAAAFHGLNILLHAANAALVYAVGKRLNFQTGASFVAALIWALHPVQAEAVIYASATADVLHAFFCLLGVFVLAKGITARRMAAACLLAVAALLSKENAVVFPFLAASLIYLKGGKNTPMRHYSVLWPLLTIVAVYTGLHLLLQTAPSPQMQMGDGAANASGILTLGDCVRSLATLPLYLKLLIWPSPLFMKHVLDTAQPLFGLLIVCGSLLTLAGIAVVFWQKKKNDVSAFSWGVFWFGGSLLPFVLFMDMIVYEHWLYLPSAGLALGVTQALASKIPASRPALMSIGCLVLFLSALLSTLTYRQTLIWKSPESFYGNIIANRDIAPEAHTNLGVFYSGQGSYERALYHFAVAERDYKQDKDRQTVDNRPALYTNIAATLLRLPEPRKAEARSYLDKALSLNPAYKKAQELSTTLSPDPQD